MQLTGQGTGNNRWTAKSENPFDAAATGHDNPVLRPLLQPVSNL